MRPNVVSLPETWAHLEQKHFENLCNTLDPNGQGKVNFKILFSFICLQSSEKVDKDDLQAYGEALAAAANPSGFITLDRFTKVFLGLLCLIYIDPSAI